MTADDRNETLGWGDQYGGVPDWRKEVYIQLRRSLIASDQVGATIFAVEMAELVEQTTGHAVSV